MASMASMLKTSCSLPPLKWRNPSLRTPTTHISLPMIKTSFCSSISRGSSLRVQCVLNNSNSNCFKKEEEVEKPIESFGKVMFTVLKALEKPIYVATLVWVLLKFMPTKIFGFWLVYDLCVVICAIASHYSILSKGGYIKLSTGPVLCLISVFVNKVFEFAESQELTMEYTPKQQPKPQGK